MADPTPSPENSEFTTGMRIFGGITWGTMLSFVMMMGWFWLPQSDPKVWIMLPLWLGLSGVGVALQWSIARGACPKCGQKVVVPPTGKRCPKCRSYLQAVNRKVTKVA